jgi:glycosyltransferase involved in cell wall biosynthesis
MSHAFEVSIVTVVFNARDALAKTMASVAQQKRLGVEYIVVDGSSSDGTAELARSKPSIVDILISDPDRGIYDAMNKGVAVARGDALLFLNAGDTLAPGAMEHLLAAAKAGADIVCHSVTLHRGGVMVGIYRPESPPKRPDPQHMYWPHPGILAKRSVFDLIGCFDCSLRFAADLDWANRVMASPAITIAYSEVAVVEFALGGVSASVAAIRETRDVAVRHGKSSLVAYVRYVKTRMRRWTGG